MKFGKLIFLDLTLNIKKNPENNYASSGKLVHNLNGFLGFHLRSKNAIAIKNQTAEMLSK
jgi:hypothetical protein